MTTHLQHKEKHHMTLLKPILSSTLPILGCAFASAQNSANEPDANSDASYNYNFQTVNFSGDAFTQLLGINSYSEIAGYHGSGAAGHPNKGFRLTLPKQFASENYPVLFGGVADPRAGPWPPQGARINHYQVLSSIGAGGMGEVYLAMDTRLRRRIAPRPVPRCLQESRCRTPGHRPTKRARHLLHVSPAFAISRGPPGCAAIREASA
jgi:hypothetical protein